MNPRKYSAVILATLITAPWLKAETLTMQEGLNGYNGCEDTYFSRHGVDKNYIYGPFGEETDLILQSGS